jgi:hypothetical protein
MQVGIMKFLPVSSKEQVADYFFTQSLLPFGILLSKLSKIDIYNPPTCWGILNHEQDELKAMKT